MWKKLLLGALVFIVAIQLIRQPKNLGASAGPADLIVSTAPDPEVSRLLQTACYDCHSNTTRYPWYAEIQPIGWLLASHVKEGKEHLNFSTFGLLTPKRAAHKLKECAEEVTEGAMPISSYKLTHPDARLTPAQRKLLGNWFGLERSKFPAE
ncbi:MAG: heme-binding domain-containing protein [Verrucomicrobia bacterium]|nr:heme-binding domain-containing protein [Verrucomicrobiota bacterium]